MPYPSYYHIDINRPNRRYHISYHTVQTSSFEKPELKKYDVNVWKFLEQGMTMPIQLTESFDESISDDIGKMIFDGFELDLNKMETERRYTISYDDSLYEVFKNKNNELVISEIG